MVSDVPGSFAIPDDVPLGREAPWENPHMMVAEEEERMDHIVCGFVEGVLKSRYVVGVEAGVRLEPRLPSTDPVVSHVIGSLGVVRRRSNRALNPIGRTRMEFDGYG